MGDESNTQTPGPDVKSNEVRSGADQFGSREQSSTAEDATPGERVQLRSGGRGTRKNEFDQLREPAEAYKYRFEKYA